MKSRHLFESPSQVCDRWTLFNYNAMSVCPTWHAQDSHSTCSLLNELQWSFSFPTFCEMSISLLPYVLASVPFVRSFLQNQGLGLPFTQMSAPQRDVMQNPASTRTTECASKGMWLENLRRTLSPGPTIKVGDSFHLTPISQIYLLCFQQATIVGTGQLRNWIQRLVTCLSWSEPLDQIL